MAAGGLAVLGATGEEYAAFVNAIVCDTGDGRELAAYLAPVVGDPIAMGKMREAGRETARRCTWPSVVRTLEHKLDFVESYSTSGLGLSLAVPWGVGVAAVTAELVHLQAAEFDAALEIFDRIGQRSSDRIADEGQLRI